MYRRHIQGKIQFHVASLYPLLYRLEKKGWVEGRWVEKAGERRRRCYKLTPAGHQELAGLRKAWKEYFHALDRVAGVSHA